MYVYIYLARTYSTCQRAASCQCPAVQLRAPKSKSVKRADAQQHAFLRVPSTHSVLVCVLFQRSRAVVALRDLKGVYFVRSVTRKLQTGHKARKSQARQATTEAYTRKLYATAHVSQGALPRARGPRRTCSPSTHEEKGSSGRRPGQALHHQAKQGAARQI